MGVHALTADLTDKQGSFVRFLTAGAKPAEAAEMAGYSGPDTECHRLLRLPHIRAALHDERQRIIETELAGVAVRTLGELMDPGIPPPVRLGATKLALALAGHAEKVKEDKGLPNKPLSEMSQAELLASIADARNLVAAADRVVIEAESVEVTDNAPNSAPSTALVPASQTAAASSEG